MNRNKIFRENISSVVYHAEAWNKEFDAVQSTHKDIKFSTNLEETEKLLDNNERQIVVFDDVLVSLTSSKKFCDSITEWFVHKSHHRNKICILLLQNLYASPCIRTISLNATYIILTKCIRDKSSIVHLAKQFSPGHPQYLKEALDHATQHGIGSYLLIDCNVIDCEEIFRVRSFIIPEYPERNCIYLPK